MATLQVNPIASGSTGNCYTVSDGATTLLLECGIPVAAIKRGTGYKLTDVAACLLTHEHGDHSKAVPALLQYSIPLYCSQGTAQALNLKDSYYLHHVHPGRVYRVGTFQFTPFKTRHDAAEPLGFLLRSTKTGERLLFVTDSFYISQRFRNLDYIMVECNHITASLEECGSPALAARLMRGHMSLATCIRFLKAQDLSRVKRIYLIHISRERGDPAHMKREVQAATGKEVTAL